MNVSSSFCHDSFVASCFAGQVACLKLQATALMEWILRFASLISLSTVNSANEQCNGPRHRSQRRRLGFRESALFRGRSDKTHVHALGECACVCSAKMRAAVNLISPPPTDVSNLYSAADVVAKLRGVQPTYISPCWSYSLNL